MMEEFIAFETVIYKAEVPRATDNGTEYNFLKTLDKACDKYVKEAVKIAQDNLDKRSKKFGDQVKDMGASYHSTNELLEDPEFRVFNKFILNTAKNVLDAQGFDLTNHKLKYTEMWVQEFTRTGGGHHDTHIHWNNHISGFYFLKCSEKTSAPIFHDPRPGKMMIQLPEKEEDKITYASSKMVLKPKPGSLIMFNSFLPHQFPFDLGTEPFRFIHFNIQALPTQLR